MGQTQRGQPWTKELHQAIEDYFETAQQAGYRAVPLERLEEVGSGHGRVEVRGSQLVPDLSTLPKPEQWKDLQGIARKANVTGVSASPPKCAITSPPSGRMSDAWPRQCGAIGGIENSAQLGAGRDLPGRRQPTSCWLWRRELRGHPSHRLEPLQTRTFQSKSQAETLQGCVKQ
jgi:hypothetical protein